MSDALVLGQQSLKIFFRKLCIVAKHRLAEESNRAKLAARFALLREALPKKHKQLAAMLEADLAQSPLRGSGSDDIITIPRTDYEALAAILRHLTLRIEQLEREREGSLASRIADLSSPTRTERILQLKERLAFLEEVLAYKRRSKKNSTRLSELSRDVMQLKAMLSSMG